MPGETRTPLRSPRSQVVQWGHASHITAHPGARRTLEFVQRHFWWPGMAKDVKSFVGNCSVCNAERRWLMCLHCRLTARGSWVRFPQGALGWLWGAGPPQTFSAQVGYLPGLSVWSLYVLPVFTRGFLH